MTEPSEKTLVTEGDMKVNIINALGDLNHVSGQVLSTINHLSTFVTENMEPGTTKNRILKQVKLIMNACNYMGEKVSEITEQAKLKHITARVTSRKRAAENIEDRINKMTKMTFKSKSYIHPNDTILAKMIKPTSIKPTSAEIILKPRTRSSYECREYVSHFVPKNGHQFTLFEAFKLMDKEDITPGIFYSEVTTITSS